jgi:hypothetical protein
MGYKAIVIEGHPQNYCKHGFKSSKDYNISDAEGKFPYSLLALELEKGFLEGREWRYLASEVYSIDPKAAEEYDKLFRRGRKSTAILKKNFILPVEPTLCERWLLPYHDWQIDKVPGNYIFGHSINGQITFLRPQWGICLQLVLNGG